MPDLAKAPLPEMAPGRVKALALTTFKVPSLAMALVGVRALRLAWSYTTVVADGMTTEATLPLVGRAPSAQLAAVDQLPPDAPV